ncbi:MAG TPA: YiiX/YebB-like N1pC/P60 family cysteine hydrolase [Bacteroidia bacterium]|nr:YiiX/YebB-like N1pC/P60 family cysteine hydrolase [Bacteroidia bacterium]
MRYFIFISLAVLSFVCLSGFTLKSDPPHKNGDLIFIVNPSGQGKAIQLATKSRFTHIGIIFIENGEEVVYHAVEPVSKNTLNEFIEMSADGAYEVRRLKNQSALTTEIIGKMLKEAKSKLGVHYDLAFNWDDQELYCSEFVWKLYKHALKIDIGSLKPLKSFDLSHPVVKAKLEQRYGNNIPLDENMISPGDMFASPLLE